MLADWLWPLQHYSRANRVPYGYQNWSDDARHQLFGTGSPRFWALSSIIVAEELRCCTGRFGSGASTWGQS